MNYLEMKEHILKLQEENYRGFVKALVSIETGIEDENLLDKMYDGFMENDDVQLLNYDICVFTD